MSLVEYPTLCNVSTNIAVAILRVNMYRLADLGHLGCIQFSPEGDGLHKLRENNKGVVLDRMLEDETL
jgi:hypothetical protein